MKILICSFGFHPYKDGVAITAALLAEGLRHSGHSVTVATGAGPDAPLPAELAGVEVRRFDVRGNASPRSRYAGDIDGYLEFISRYDADVAILLCWQIWSTDLALRALPRRVKAVVLSQGVWLSSFGRGFGDVFNWLFWKPYSLWRMPRMLRRLDRLVLPSTRLAGVRFYDHRLALALGAPIDFIPNTVHPLPGRGGFRRHHAIVTPYLVFLLGNFGTAKNQVLAVEAFRKLKRDDVTLVLAGFEGNDYSAELERRLRSSPLIQWRILIGLDDAAVWDAYAECDLVLVTSTTEYQPLVALQAMSAGKPVVSTDVGCVGDLPGCTVVPSDPGSMAAAIESLLDAPERRQAMGRAAAEAFRTSFAFDVVAGKWDRLVRALASEARLSRED